jgi:thiol-disulfide isomerase/thioredoxin
MLRSFALAALLGMVALPFAARAEPVDFELPDVKGKPHKLSDYRGKWVLVNYWATWCPPCLEELPELVIFHELHKDNDAVVLGVNFEDVDTAKLQKFIDNYSISYPVVRSKPGPGSALGPIPGLPTSYLINPKGEVVAQKVGPVTGKSIEKFMADEVAVKQ